MHWKISLLSILRAASAGTEGADQAEAGSTCDMFLHAANAAILS